MQFGPRQTGSTRIWSKAGRNLALSSPDKLETKWSMSKTNALSNRQPHWHDYDVAVLGGGPAGAAASITLARAGRSVVVIEKSLYDRARIGETLPPVARRPLLNLLVWEQFVAAGHLPSSGNLSVWGDEELYQDHFIFNPYGQGWHLDRRRFSAMLAEAARQAGASLFRGSADSRKWRARLVTLF
jgi:2-polyprenyl-6-methoxyphenol hydroxylase-like FAD-dependent oxidoreductase